MPSSVPKNIPEKSRILIVDDFPVVRRGLAQMINHEPDLLVCCEAGNVAEAIEELRDEQPHLAIVDVSLDGVSGLGLVKTIKARFPLVPVLVMSMHDETLYAERALRIGAKGYIMKREQPADVINAIRQVLRGNIYVSDKMRSKMLQQLIDHQPATADSPVAGLSDMELEVLRLIGRGSSSREIAVALSRSIKTIEGHRANIKDKLRLQSGNDLIRFAAQWIELAD